MGSDVGILAGRILFAFQREMFARLAAAGHDAVRPQHGAVFAYLDRHGTRATELASRSGQHKVVIGRLVDELEELGYLTREADPADRRAKLVVPTERGLDYMRHAGRIGDDMTAAYRRAFGPKEWDSFLHSFERLVAIAVDRAPDASS